MSENPPQVGSKILSLDTVKQDVRYTFRVLRRDRGFAVVAVLILALGIGANIAVFSVVNHILFRPLPFSEPQQLTWIAGKYGKGLSDVTYSMDALEEFQAQNHSFREVTAYMPFYGASDYRLTGWGQPQPVSGLMVGANFFQVLGVQPELGRFFTADECVKGGRPAVLLSHAFWQAQFSANPAIVGQTITLNGVPTTVVGVLPASFDFGSIFAPGAKMDVFVPIIPDFIRDWGNTLCIIGRLQTGVSVEQAQAEADLLFPRFHFNLKHPEWGGDYTARITLLGEYVRGKLRHSLALLWCAVGAILLIVCVNLSNLQLARAAARDKETALRSALGAGRARLIRQWLTESCMLSGAGAALGWVFALATTRYLAHQGSVALPLLSTVRVDGTALGWTLLIATVVGMLLGLAPALRLSRADLQGAMKDAGPTLSQGREQERLRAGLVVSEIALACVLVVAAGLLLRSFLRVLDVDLGFEPSHAAAIAIDYNDGGQAERRGPILEDILGHIRALPGVEDAGVTDMLPLDRNRSWGLEPKGSTFRRSELQGTFVYIITPGYLRAMGMHLLSGRDFTWQDSTRSLGVVIVGQTAARFLWQGRDPVGQLAIVNGKDTRVIGVVADVRETSVETGSGWQMYLPVTQEKPEGAELVIRTKLPTGVLAQAVMKTLRTLNPGQARTTFRELQQIVDHAVSPRRFFVMLVSAFALLGLVLAALGVYGVISYSVTRQTRELGIRMALGATPEKVLSQVAARSLRLALTGVTAGLLVSLAVAKLIATLLYGTAPMDAVTFAGTVLLLLAVTLLAGYFPARRASRVDPIVALRNN